MTKNLKSKVMNIVEDTQGMNNFQRAERIERLVLDELEHNNTTHTIGLHELESIRQKALHAYHDHSPQRFQDNYLGSSENITAWCYVDAVVNMLRGKGLLTANIEFDRSKK